MTEMNLESIRRVNEFLKDREFIIVFPPARSVEQKAALARFNERYGFGWKPLTIYVRFEPAEHGAGLILVKDGRKRSVLDMDTSGFDCKIYPFGHNFDAAAIPGVYRELTGMQMEKVRFMTADFRTFFRRGDNLKSKEI